MQILSVVLVILGLFVQGLFTEEVRKAIGLRNGGECSPVVVTCPHASRATVFAHDNRVAYETPGTIVDVIERRYVVDTPTDNQGFSDVHVATTNSGRRYTFDELSSAVASPGRITLETDD
jgi:hypothetical protein